MRFQSAENGLEKRAEFGIIFEDRNGDITVNFQKPYPAGGEAVPDCKVVVEK